MGMVLKPWFSVVVLVAAVSVWAFTVGPWGALHERTAASSRLEVRGDTYTRQSVTSPPFSLSGGPATIRIAATPSAGASPASSTLIASVAWRLVPSGTRTSQASALDQGLMSPHLDTGAKDLADVVGAEPSGRYRMSLAAISDTPATIIATLVEQRGYWHGIPVLWIILMLGAAYIGLNVALQRRRYPPSPIVTVQRRDSV